MGYADTYSRLAEAFAAGGGSGPLDTGMVLHVRHFQSEAPVPGAAGAVPPPDSLIAQLNRDLDVAENVAFPYRILAPVGPARHRRAVLLLHGLNERQWEKYLPWARALVEGLGVPVILFPIAFHMERSPSLWAEPRPMHRVSRERLRALPQVEASTFVNAALSTRLHARPDRFVWAGLRTLHDVERLAAEVHRGEEPLLAPGARLDVFGYSIGAYLAEILLMADAGGHFADARLVTFCGGCLFSQHAPVAREILDSAAARALNRLLVEELAWEKQLRPELGQLLAEDRWGRTFASMLRPDWGHPEREEALRRIGPRVAALALADDRVVPAAAVEETLSGSGAWVETLTLPYAAEHVTPFPHQGVEAAWVDRGFEAVFSRALRWLA